MRSNARPRAICPCRVTTLFYICDFAHLRCI
nr:MAG TPA: hypothetical protein [Caudoviricetes sp.]